MKRHSVWSLGWTLIALALRGWREVPGYTCCQREYGDQLYIAIQLTKDH